MSSKYNMIEFRVWRSSILARNSVRASSERNTDVCLTINHSSQVVRAKPCKVSSVQLALTEQFPIPDTRSNFCEVNHSRTHAWGEPPLIKNLVKIQIFVHFPFWKINDGGWNVLWSQTDNKSIHKQPSLVVRLDSLIYQQYIFKKKGGLDTKYSSSVRVLQETNQIDILSHRH